MRATPRGKGDRTMSRMEPRRLLATVALVAAVLLPTRDEMAATKPPPSHRGTSTGASGTAAPSTSKLDPKALALLQAMSQRLAAAHALTFTALSTEESPTRHGRHSPTLRSPT